MAELLPDLNGKSILDLGCGYGQNCIGFINRGAKSVVGVGISKKECSELPIQKTAMKMLFNKLYVFFKKN